jgi:hypothetical protein
LDKQQKEEMEEAVAIDKDLYFESYLQADRTTRGQEKNEYINNNTRTLGLEAETDETLMTYKDVLTDRYKVDEHFNIIRLLQSDDCIQN